MKMLHLVVSLCFLTALFSAHLACAKDGLRILTVHEPPSNYVDAKGENTGFSIDVVKEIQRRIHDTTPIQMVPEKRLLDMVESGPPTVIIGISRTPHREDRYRWVTNVLSKPWILYAYVDEYGEISTLEQAKKVKVGVVHGDVREEYVREHGFQFIEGTSSHLSNMRKLLEGRIDLAFLEPQGVAYECAARNLDASLFEPRVMPHVSEVYIAMSKNTDEKTFLRWEKAAQEMKQDGTFLSIARRWSRELNRQFGIVSRATTELLIFTQ